VDSDISYADQTRTVKTTPITVSVIQCHTASLNSRHSHTHSNTTPDPGKPVVCFYCTKQLHNRKSYFLRLAQLHKRRAGSYIEARTIAARPEECWCCVRVVAEGRDPSVEITSSVLIDSEWVRSLNSFNYLEQLSLVDLNLQLLTTDLSHVTASGDSLEIVDQVKVLLKIHVLWWSWMFLVSRNLRG
jgi:hypothetical protein